MTTTTTARTARLEITAAPYVRSHGRTPKGSGTWAFRKSSTYAAFEADLTGDVIWIACSTFAAAKKALQADGHSGLYAVLS